MKKILIPTLLMVLVAFAAAAADAPDATGTVNINSATVEELQLLPRIGPALAQRIVDFREANGPFASADELVAVKGIGERSLESLTRYLSVEGDTTLAEKVRLPRSGSDR